MRSKNRFAPMVEALESRRTPAVTFTQTGGALNIVGTGGDTISVNATSPGAFTAQQGTDTPLNFRGVSQVNIRLGGGENNVTANLGPARVLPDVDLNIVGNSATTGTDNVTVNLGSGLVKGEHADINVALGNGTNNFTLGGSLGRPGGATLNNKSQLDLNYLGGSGVDTVVLNFLNINKGAEADLNVALGAGNDSFSMNLPTTGPNGVLDKKAEVDLSVNGGTGTDTANFRARDASSDGIDVSIRNIEQGNLAAFANNDDDNDNDDDDNDNDNDNDD